MNLICGINPVIEALAAGTRHFDRLLVVKGLRSRRLTEAIRRATRLGIPLRFEMRETLDRMAGGVPHQGLIAVVSAKPLLSLEQMLETARAPALLVALDGVEDPRNLGAILRSVEAAGADGALLPERHSAGLSEVVGRTSAGALEHVPVARVGNLVQAIETLKANGVWVVGFDATGTERWDSVDLNRPVCLVLGGEGRGIRRLVREHCDHLVSIPHFGHVSSLNVSVAAGIALYEAVRQRGTVPSAVRPIPTVPANREGSSVVGPSADDPETDPGAAPQPHTDQEPDPGVGEGDEHNPETLAAHVDIHGEEVAWGQGPTVLKPVSSRRGRRLPARRQRPGRRGSGSAKGGSKNSDGRPRAGQRGTPARDGKAREAASRDDPVEPASPEPNEASPGEGGGAKRGRRRRRKRPAKATASTPAPASKGGPQEGGEEPENPGKATPKRRRRGRRRR